MKRTIAIIAALPGELKPLVSPPGGVDRWERLKASKGTVLWQRTHGEESWLAGCSGMGASAVTLTLREMERYKAVDAICSVGWAGALDETTSVGSVWHVAQVIDTQTGERFTAAHSQSRTHPVLATVDRVAGAEEKVRLAASYGATLVDMEAATLARIASARGIPFYCLKAVSDDADENLPDFNRFVMTNGQMRMMLFLAHVAMRPHRWRGLARLGRSSSWRRATWGTRSVRGWRVT